MRKLQYMSIMCVLVFTVTVVAESNLAQMGVTKPSLEWQVAASDVVVRASILDLSGREPKMLAGGAESQSAWITVTLKVHETLKGKHPEKITFVAEIFRGSDLLQEWKDSREGLIWFLDHTKLDADEPKYQDYEVYTRHDLKLIRWGWGWSVIQMTSRPTERGIAPPIFTLDLRVLEHPKEILEAARAAVVAAGQAKRPEEHGVRVARLLMQRTGKSGDVNELVVPVDHRLEKAARQWTRWSADNLLEKLGDLRPEQKDNPAFRRGLEFEKDLMRWEGVKALAHFKSDENVALLKTLFDDPASWQETKDEGSDTEVEERVYFVRQEAYETLQKWGVQVHKPMIRERLPRKERE